MFKFAGVTLDHYDDKGETLKRIFPSAEVLPDVIKTANVRPQEQLSNEQFALVANDNGYLLRKYAMNDAGNTAMSVIYFMEHGDKLPKLAQKHAAAHLADACVRYGMLPPLVLTKIAMGGSPGEEAKETPEHEAAESPEEEAAEHAQGAVNASPNAMSPADDDYAINRAVGMEPTGGEGHKEEPGPKPGSIVDLTGQAPEAKVAFLRPRSNDDYAVVLDDGRRMYPIDTWDNVKLAMRYYEENSVRMPPPIRRQFAVKLAAKAEQLGIQLEEQVKEAGATTYADPSHMKASIEMRKVAFQRGSEEARFLDDLFEKRAELHPEVYAECLRRFDVMNDFDRAWDHGFINPWDSTFGLDKTAEHVVWEEGAERVTERELNNLAVNGTLSLQGKFSQNFLDAFQKDPTGIFDSMPLPQKKILARLANDVAGQGGSESGRATDGVKMAWGPLLYGQSARVR